MCVCSNNCNGKSSTSSVQQATVLRVGLFVFLERKWFKNKPDRVLPRKVFFFFLPIDMFQDSLANVFFFFEATKLKNLTFKLSFADSHVGWHAKNVKPFFFFYFFKPVS